MINLIKLLSILIFLNTYILASGSSKDSIKGNIKFFYYTTDSKSLFKKESSYLDVYLNIEDKIKLSDNLVSNIGVSFISTLGLDNNLADFTWINHNNGKSRPEDMLWVDIANIEYSISNSKVTFGRQALDTPLILSESWNIATNTFDAIKVNIDEFEYFNSNVIFITRTNGNTGSTVNAGNLLQGGMQGFGEDKNKSIAIIGVSSDIIEYSTIDAWFYRMPNNFTAYWLEANRENDNLEIGLQLVQLSPSSHKGVLGAAAKIGFSFDDSLSVMAAISTVDNKDKSLNNDYNISNLAGNLKGGGASSLYTEGFWWLGKVGAEGATSYKVESNIALRLMDLTVGFLKVNGSERNKDLSEFYISSTIEYDIFDISLSFINDKVGGTNVNTLIATFVIPFTI